MTSHHSDDRSTVVVPLESWRDEYRDQVSPDDGSGGMRRDSNGSSCSEKMEDLNISLEDTMIFEQGSANALVQGDRSGVITMSHLNVSNPTSSSPAFITPAAVLPQSRTRRAPLAKRWDELVQLIHNPWNRILTEFREPGPIISPTSPTDSASSARRYHRSFNRLTCGHAALDDKSDSTVYHKDRRVPLTDWNVFDSQANSCRQLLRRVISGGSSNRINVHTVPLELHRSTLR